jgi:hypothetical protein
MQHTHATKNNTSNTLTSFRMLAPIAGSIPSVDDSCNDVRVTARGAKLAVKAAAGEPASVTRTKVVVGNWNFIGTVVCWNVKGNELFRCNQQ